MAWTQPTDHRCRPARGERDRAALMARIRRRYATRTERLQLGPVTLDLTRVANPDETLVHMEAEAQAAGGAEPPWQPYWAEAWDSAYAIAAVLAGEPLTDVAVLDLGCGLGLTGAAAAARGARVLMADAARPALLFARLNAWPWRDRVRIRCLDWRRDPLAGERFALIVGADILYDRHDWPYLERFWRTHLEAAGRVLLGEPGRGISAAFPAWLAARGWQVTARDLDTPSGRRPIRLLQATPVPSES